MSLRFWCALWISASAMFPVAIAAGADDGKSVRPHSPQMSATGTTRVKPKSLAREMGAGITDIFWTADDKRLIMNAGQIGSFDVELGKLTLLTGPQGPVVNRMVRSPDQKSMALMTIASPDRSQLAIEFWSIDKPGEAPLSRTRPIKDLVRVAYSSDGAAVYSVAYAAKVIQVWSSKTGALTREIPVDGLKITSMAASPVGHLLAINGESSAGEGLYETQLWDAKTGKLLQKLGKPQSSRAESMEFSSDGHLVAVGTIHRKGDYQATIQVYDCESGKLVHELLGHVADISVLKFFPDNQRLLSASKDFTMRVWDIKKGTLVSDLIGISNDIRAVAISPSGEWIVSGDNRGKIQFWDISDISKSPDKFAKSGAEAKNWIAHPGEFANDMDVSTDGRFLVSQGDETLKLWNVETGSVIKSSAIVRSGRGVAISPDSSQFACAGEFAELELRSTTDGELQFKINDVKVAGPKRIIYSPDGRRLIVACEENIAIVGLNDRKVIKTIQADDQPVEQIAMTSDGKRLAVGCKSGKVKYWDLETFMPLEVLNVGEVRLWSVKFSPDNSLLATTLPQKSLDIWEVASGKKIASAKTYYEAGGLDTVFIPGSNLLAIQTGTDYKIFPDNEFRTAICLIDVMTGKTVKTLTGHARPVVALRYLPKQKQLVTFSADGMIKFWDIDPASLK